MSERPSDILMRWAQDGLLRTLLPDLDALRGVSQAPAHRDDAFIHTLKVVDAIAPTPTRRWAALLHDVGKSPTFIETPEGRSRFFEHDRVGAEMAPDIMAPHVDDPHLIENVRRLVSLHMRPIAYNPEWTEAAVRRLAEEAQEGRGEGGWNDLLALSRADLHGYLPEPIDRGLWTLDRLEERKRKIDEAEKEAARERAVGPRSPLNGGDILALTTRQPGPWVGQLKDYLRREVEAGRLSRDDRAGARSLALRWLGNE